MCLYSIFSTHTHFIDTNDFVSIGSDSWVSRSRTGAQGDGLLLPQPLDERSSLAQCGLQAGGSGRSHCDRRV